MKRTPGKWTANRPAGAALGWSVWAEVPDKRGRSWLEPVAHGLKRGDAELMAAAPELEEVLDTIVYWHDQGSGHVDDSWWQAAREAVAKAKGKR